MALSITTIAPDTGPTSGGTAITITGTDFLSNATVAVGGSALTGLSVNSSTEITGTTPAGTAGAADVVLTQVLSYTTWVEGSSSGARAWSCIDCSDDGSVIVMGASGSNNLYVSTDGGTSFSAVAVSANWFAVCCSADGSVMYGSRQGATPYKSTDSGATWTNLSTAPNFYGIDCSADGQIVVGVTYGGQIRVSTDGGATWGTYATTRNWYRVSCSADGSVMLACVYGAGNYAYYSTDTGANWAQAGSGTNIRAVAVSADGSTLYAGVSGGTMYRSDDSGANWSSLGSNQIYNAVACSPDGQIAVAGSNTGLHYSVNAGATWTNFTTNSGLGVALPVTKTYAYGAVFARQMYTSAAAWDTYTATGGFTYELPLTYHVTRLAAEALIYDPTQAASKPTTFLIL